MYLEMQKGTFVCRGYERKATEKPTNAIQLPLALRINPNPGSYNALKTSLASLLGYICLVFLFLCHLLALRGI